MAGSVALKGNLKDLHQRPVIGLLFSLEVRDDGSGQILARNDLPKDVGQDFGQGRIGTDLEGLHDTAWVQDDYGRCAGNVKHVSTTGRQVADDR